MFLGCDEGYDGGRNSSEGNHTITAGYRILDIFNLFYQHVDTEIRFDGIDNFRAGNAARIYYGNANTNFSFSCSMGIRC